MPRLAATGHYPRPRHLLQRDGHVVELAAACQTAHFGANEKDSMTIVSARSAFHLRQRRRGEEADELEVRRCRIHGLQPGEQSAWGGTSGTDIDAAASPDRCQSTLCGNELWAEIKRFLASG